MVKMENIDSILSFPCNFPIKVMGKAENEFDSLVVELVRRHYPDILEGAVKTRLSNGGKYMSVTVIISAKSRSQLDKIYEELSSNKRVLMAL